jgi:hypothetical protein
MTVATEYPRTLLSPTVPTGTFVVGFSFADDADLVVTVTPTGGSRLDRTLGVHYIVTGDYLAGGGQVEFVPAYWPPAHAQVEILRRTPIEQPSGYGDVSRFMPRQIEASLDRLTRAQQEARLAAEIGVRGEKGDPGEPTDTVGTALEVPGLALAGRHAIRTTGRASAGDRGDGLFGLRSGLPAHSGYVVSSDGVVFELADPVVRPQQFGAGAAGFASAFALGRAVEASGLTYAVTSSLAVPAGARLEGRGGLISGQTGTALRFDGDDAVVVGLSMTGVSTDQVIGASAGANVTVRDVRIDCSSSSAAGHGVQMNVGALDAWTLDGLDIVAKGFGLLVNTNAGGSDGLMVLGARLISETGDAIEYNAPGTALYHVLTWGCVLTVSGGSSVNSGFGLGMAHVQGFVAGGLVIRRSRQEALHFEDGCHTGAIVGVAGRNVGGDGVRHLIGIANKTESAPLAFVGLAFESVGGVANSSGFRNVWDTNGVQTRSPLVAGVFRGFSYGAWLDGPGLYAATYLSFQGITTALLKVANARTFTQVPGDFFSKDAPLFVECSDGSGFTLPKFHEENYLPNPMVTRLATRRVPGIKLRGFSGRCPDFTNSAGVGAQWVPLFAAPVRMRGALTLFIQWAGNGFGIFWEGDVLYTGYLVDGVTASTAFLPATNVIKDLTSDFDVATGAPLRINSGMVEISLYFSNAASRLARIWVEFEGAYYV